MMETLLSMRHTLIPSLLTESQNNEDLTIICKNGKYCCNAFLFASIFPGLSPVLECLLYQEEAPSVSIPDVSVKDLVEFFNSVYQQDSRLKTRQIESLLQWTKIAIESKRENYKDNIKYEVEDYTPELLFGIDNTSPELNCDDKEIVKLKIVKETKPITQEEDNDSDWGGDTGQNCSDSEPEEEVKRRKNKKGARRNVRNYERKKKIDKVTMMSFEYDELNCSVCELEFKSESGLWSHVYRKHGPHRQQICDDCNEVFTDQTEFENHKRKVHGERVSCPDCGKMLLKIKLNQHIKQVHGPKDYVYCNECGKKFCDKYQLKKHIETIHDGIKRVSSHNKLAMECDKACNCNIKFSSMKEKIEHCKLVHLGYEQCVICLKIILKDRVMNHVCDPNWKKKQKKRDREPQVCDVCSETFNSYSALWYHRTIKHKAEKVSCEKCGKVFDSYIYLADHVKYVHAEKKACKLCGAVVKHLDDHMLNVHTEDSKKSRQCQYCGKGFLDQQKLDRHVMSMHLKLKPYKCRYGCDIAYNDYSNRNHHERKKHGGLFTSLSPS